LLKSASDRAGRENGGAPHGAGARAAAAVDAGARRIAALAGWKRAGFAFIAGVMAALAMAPVYALPLLTAGFSIFILLIDGAGVGPAGRRRRLRAFAAGWFFGFGFFLAGTYWMAFSFFVQADEFAWMAPFAMAGLPAFLALFSGAAAALCAQFWRPGWRRVFLFAAIWSVFEFLRGHVLTGLPWNLAGQALAGSALTAQAAAWGGAYGLSLVTALLAGAPAAGLGGERAAPGVFGGVFGGAAAMAAGFAVLLAAGALRLAAPEPAPDGEAYVRIVQPNIPQREKIDPGLWGRNFTRNLDLSEGPAPPDARLFVVWPENAAPLLAEAPTALTALGQTLPDNAVLIAGAVRRAPDAGGVMRYYNSVLVLPDTPAGRRPVAYYDKHHLVPFGEYLPFYGFLRAVGLAQLAPYGDSGFTAGPGPAVLNAGGPSFSPMICYEAIFPRASYPRGRRPDWLVTVTNDAWFGDTSGPRQHLDMARLRAIEAGLPMARAANTGISALIDAKGRVLERVPLYESGKIEAALPSSLPLTLYDRGGNIVFWILTLVFLAIAMTRPTTARFAR